MEFKAISTFALLFSLLIGNAFTLNTFESSYSSIISSLDSTYSRDSNENSYSESEASASDTTWSSSKSGTIESREYVDYTY